MRKETKKGKKEKTQNNLNQVETEQEKHVFKKI